MTTGHKHTLKFQTFHSALFRAGLIVKARTGGLSVPKSLEGTILADKKVDLLGTKVVGKSRGETKVGGMMKIEGKIRAGERISENTNQELKTNGNMILEARINEGLMHIASKKRGARNRIVIKIVDAPANNQDNHQNEMRGGEVLNVKKEKEILHLVVLKIRDEVNIEENENTGNGMWITIIKVRYKVA